MITSDNSSSGGEIEIEGRGTFENLTNSTFNLKSTEVWCRFAEDDYSVSGFQVSFAADVAAVVVVVTPVIFCCCCRNQFVYRLFNPFQVYD